MRIRISKTRQNSEFKRILIFFGKADRRKVSAIVLIQIFLGLLDLMGILAIGLLGAMSVNGVQSKTPSGSIQEFLSIIGISKFTLQMQFAVIGSSIVLLLVGRTALSMLFTRRILHFMSIRGAVLSAELVSRFLSMPILTIQRWTSQEALFAVNRGVEIAVMQVMALTIVAISDFVILLVLLIGLFVIDPITCLGTIIIFAGLVFILVRIMHAKAGELGKDSSRLGISSNELVIEVFSTLRESFVKGRLDYYSRQISKGRIKLAAVNAEINFMPFISKYVIETVVILGALLIGFAQFLINDAVQAVANLAIFLAAVTRIAPAVLRIQQSAVQIKSGLGLAKPTLDLIELVGSQPLNIEIRDRLELQHEGFTPEVSIKGVNFIYPGKNVRALSNINLEIKVGSVTAIIGPSGAGKTTLVDILLGLIEPDSGLVRISGVASQEAIRTWPGAIAYVPQEVVVVNASIRENIGLGYPAEFATDDLVNRAIELASLAEFVLSQPNKLEEVLGERGAMISGGQRQRIGIARALFTQPKLLVLDEATSSLDGGTEANISRDIKNLKGKTTVVIIAHRLSTIRDADDVIYLDDGKIIAQGTFEEVCAQVPELNKQAKKS